MQLINKQEMMAKNWNSFDHYPRINTDIVLHIRGYLVRENKYIHDFYEVYKFDARFFDCTKYIPKNIKERIVWEYSWLPISELELHD